MNYAFEFEGKVYPVQLSWIHGASVLGMIPFHDHAYTVRQDTGGPYWEHPVVAGDFVLDLANGPARLYRVPPCFFRPRR